MLYVHGEWLEKNLWGKHEYLFKGKYKEEACQGMRKSLLFLNGKVKTGLGKDAEIGVKITERNLLE